jgi:predicted ATPase
MNPLLHSISLQRDRVPSFDAFPFAIPAVRELHSLDLHPQVTFFIGENGTGKSTILEAIALVEGFAFEGGSRNFTVKPDDPRYGLARALGVNRGVRRARHDSFYLRAESFYNVATQIDELGMGDAYGGKSLHAQSHGESFMEVFTTRMTGQGLYLLDEPEAALSPQRQLAFLAALHELVLRDSQFIIATHSPIIMAYPHASILQFSDLGIHPVAYTDTEHYKVTKMFLTRTEKMLADLLGDETPT